MKQPSWSLYEAAAVFFFAPEMCDQIPISGDKVWEMGPQNGSSNLFL